MHKQVNSILLAEDDEDDVLLFKEAIRCVGRDIDLTVVANGRHLLHLLETISPPDMIVMDLVMPEMDGYQCLLTLRANGRYSNVPVLIFTTSANYHQRTRCLEAGADFFVVKTSRFSDTMSLLHDVCSGTLSERFTSWD